MEGRRRLQVGSGIQLDAQSVLKSPNHDPVLCWDNSIASEEDKEVETGSAGAVGIGVGCFFFILRNKDFLLFFVAVPYLAADECVYLGCSDGVVEKMRKRRKERRKKRKEREILN